MLMRIRLARGPAERTLTAEQYQSEFRIAYAEPDGAGIEGIVTLGAVIGTDGSIQTLGVRSGDARLAKAALETVRHWSYQPLLVNGKPVEVVTEIDVHFKL
jgi:TonB family protein